MKKMNLRSKVSLALCAGIILVAVAAEVVKSGTVTDTSELNITNIRIDGVQKTNTGSERNIEKVFECKDGNNCFIGQVDVLQNYFDTNREVGLVKISSSINCETPSFANYDNEIEQIIQVDGTNCSSQDKQLTLPLAPPSPFFHSTVGVEDWMKHN